MWHSSLEGECRAAPLQKMQPGFATWVWIAAVSSHPSSMAGSLTLHEGGGVRVTLDAAPRPDSYSHLRIVATEDRPLQLETVESVLALTDQLLDKGDAFQTSWDLRSCQVPSSAVMWKCVGWAVPRRAKLNSLNKRMALCMPDRPSLLNVVRFVLKLFGPACPVIVSEDEEACVTFMQGPS